ncbi:MAG: hypothetical protein JEZ03_13540 [Bacteroidales bacterium]|nr:hypothetical protein [Bacteroidales bacterium]
MKTWLRFAVLILIATACSSSGKIKEEVVKEFTDGTPQQVNSYQIKSDTQILISEKTFYKNGQLRSEGSFSEGEKRHGKWIFWYEDGKVWSEGTYENGEENGMKISYYPSGTKRFEGKSQKGKRVGMWLFYDEAGNIVLELDYDKKN